MTAAPPVSHAVPPEGLNGASGHLAHNLPRYQAIAMNPNPPAHPAMPPPEQMVQNHHYRHYAPPPTVHESHSGPPPPPPAPALSSLDQIEARLRQLEHEEMNRMAARQHLLAIRKREDEEFRRMTESAEAEEEDLRRQRKKIKRESMGLGQNQTVDSPPMRPTASRRLSETSAATTLAFFKQQSPPEPRQTPLPPISRTPQPPPHLMHPQSQHPAGPPAPPSQSSSSQHSHSQAHPSQSQNQHQHSHQHPHQHHPSHQHQAQHHHQHPHPHSHSHPHPHQHPHSHQHPQQHQPHQQHHQHQHSVNSHEQINGAGSVRRKQKYTIKNVEAWGERHGRPAAHDPSGRALWKRPSDGSLVYLTCPIQGCGKSDFVTLHGFMCHLTKKHKDRTLGSQSRALEMCGLIYDPNAPLPPVQASNRASMEDSPLDGGLDDEGHDPDMESEPEDSEESREEMYRMKTEASERHMIDGQRTPESQNASPVPPRPTMGSSNKPSISSIIDRTPDSGSGRETLSSAPSSESLSQGLTPVSMEQSVPLKRKYEYSPGKENAELRMGSASE
ncbi:Uncharacterized protein PECH_005104 [Penicillium ucsense]|uniref:Uncharacterized protein n=1 Tax=Penicillium ucsense TaxID=2839758 RepID=A0A8J8W6K3_9EURO|nr:Uncharacterized protein PECM_005920 [Penicillium ucsense]KAF7736597.1 Uncharacterized protein PECH_005104 [Penicillium ucsense]